VAALLERVLSGSISNLAAATRTKFKREAPLPV